MFSVIQRNTNFYNELYVHILWEIFIVLNHDEMNCNIVFRVFYNVFQSADSGYMQ
jgi:hypothetical protein